LSGVRARARRQRAADARDDRGEEADAAGERTLMLRQFAGQDRDEDEVVAGQYDFEERQREECRRVLGRQQQL
jgi:hypothetical protein